MKFEGGLFTRPFVAVRSALALLFHLVRRHGVVLKIEPEWERMKSTCAWSKLQSIIDQEAQVKKKIAGREIGAELVSALKAEKKALDHIKRTNPLISTICISIYNASTRKGALREYFHLIHPGGFQSLLSLQTF